MFPRRCAKTQKSSKRTFSEEVGRNTILAMWSRAGVRGSSGATASGHRDTCARVEKMRCGGAVTHLDLTQTAARRPCVVVVVVVVRTPTPNYLRQASQNLGKYLLGSSFVFTPNSPSSAGSARERRQTGPLWQQPGRAPSRRRAQRLGSLFAELHCGLSLASTSAGTERAGWHLHLH